MKLGLGGKLAISIVVVILSIVGITLGIYYGTKGKSKGASTNSVNLASTTTYGGEGDGDDYLNNNKDSSCGCNVLNQDADVLSTYYNAATNDRLYGINSISTPRSDWNCGSGCGKCYRLTTTGRRSDNPSGSWNSSDMPVKGQTIDVVTTNFCPYTDNTTWCASVSNEVGPTDTKYKYHFDLQNPNWKGCNGSACNAEVEFSEIKCPNKVVKALQENCVGGSTGVTQCANNYT